MSDPTRRRSTLPVAQNKSERRTQQQFKEELDVNRIVERAKRGIMPQFFARGSAVFGDFSKVPDLTEAYDTIQKAEQAFMSLPSRLRQELDNDPRNLDQLTKEQLERYGLTKEHEEKIKREQALRERKYQRDLDRELDRREEEESNPPSPPAPRKGVKASPKGGKDPGASDE